MDRVTMMALVLRIFAIGTTEFVVLALFPEVVPDLGVDIPTAGLLVTGYALGVAIGGPVLTAITGRLPRKDLLFVLVAVFVVANVFSGLVPDYGTLMASRVAASLTHGTFIVVSVVASELVSEEKKASARASLAFGLTLATIIGVPLGTLIGQEFGWRATFWVIAGLGVLGSFPSPFSFPACHVTLCRNSSSVERQTGHSC